MRLLVYNLPLQSSLYSKYCINKNHSLVKFRTPNLKSLAITCGITGLITATATTASTTVTIKFLSFIGISFVFFCLLKCDVMPVDDGLVSVPQGYAHITPVVNSDELVSMNQTGVLNVLTTHRVGAYLDCHITLNTILNHLRTN